MRMPTMEERWEACMCEHSDVMEAMLAHPHGQYGTAFSGGAIERCVGKSRCHLRGAFMGRVTFQFVRKHTCTTIGACVQIYSHAVWRGVIARFDFSVPFVEI